MVESLSFIHHQNYMQNIAFFCKSYSRDIGAFGRLLKSFALHNSDNIRLYVSVPAADLDRFNSLAALYSNIQVLTDESYAADYFTLEKSWGISLGYLNQEICKLSFWELGLVQNYLCIDSDALFIRNFRIRDFLREDAVPFSVLTMDSDLNCDPAYRNYWVTRQAHVERIFSTVGLSDQRYMTCHGMTILSSAVLKDMKLSFMARQRLSYADLMKIAPLEFTWYNAWLQKTQLIPIVPVEPFFKTFHTFDEYSFWRLKLVSLDDFARGYLGIVINSNWSREMQVSLQKPSWKLSLLNAVVRKLLA